MAEQTLVRGVAEILAGTRVFAALTEPARLALAASGRAHRLDMAADLFTLGDPSDALYVILSGELEAASNTADGRDVWMASLAAGTVVGEIGVLDGGPRTANVRAVRRSELWRIGRETVLDTLRTEPVAALELLAVMAERLRRTDLLLHEMAVQSLGARLARLLLGAGGAAVSLSQGEMARQIGASRERVNRKLAEWRAAGWIAVGAFGVKVSDREALQRLLSDAPGL